MNADQKREGEFNHPLLPLSHISERGGAGLQACGKDAKVTPASAAEVKIRNA
jgi:hypothetical protein